MARWQRFKGKVLPLQGVVCNIEVRDSSVSAIDLADLDGHAVRITSTYGLEIYVPAPPETETKWKVTGTVGDLAKVDELFGNEYEAKDFVARWKGKQVDDAVIDLTIEKVKVPVE